MLYLWLKAFHVFFVVSWFAGLFYLPRLFVNLAQTAPASSDYERLLGMAQRLKRFMVILMLGTWLFGVAIICSNGQEGMAMWAAQKWLWAKLPLVLALTAYDGYCKALLRDFAARRNRRSHVWYRWFNEFPTFCLLAICVLVIVKPF